LKVAQQAFDKGRYDIQTLTTLLDVLGENASQKLSIKLHVGNFEADQGELALNAALKLYNVLQDGDNGINCKPNVVTYNTAIKIFGRNGKFNKALEIAQQAFEKKKYNIQMLNTLLNVLGENASQKPSIKLHVGNFKARQGERALDAALRLYDVLQTRDNGINCKPDVVTYTTAIKIFGCNSELQRAWNIYAKLIVNGDYNLITIYTMLRALRNNPKEKISIDDGVTKEAHEIAEDITKQLQTKNSGLKYFMDPSDRRFPLNILTTGKNNKRLRTEQERYSGYIGQFGCAPNVKKLFDEAQFYHGIFIKEDGVEFDNELVSWLESFNVNYCQAALDECESLENLEKFILPEIATVFSCRPVPITHLYVNFLKKLIQKGEASKDITLNCINDTILHYVVRYEDFWCNKLKVGFDAMDVINTFSYEDFLKENADGFTPVDMAMAWSNKALVKGIKKAFGCSKLCPSAALIKDILGRLKTDVSHAQEIFAIMLNWFRDPKEKNDVVPKKYKIWKKNSLHVEQLEMLEKQLGIGYGDKTSINQYATFFPQKRRKFKSDEKEDKQNQPKIPEWRSSYETRI